MEEKLLGDRIQTDQNKDNIAKKKKEKDEIKLGSGVGRLTAEARDFFKKGHFIKTTEVGRLGLEKVP